MIRGGSDANRGIVTKRTYVNGSAGETQYYLHRNTNGDWSFAVETDSGAVGTASPYESNKWTHLAETYDGTTVKLYVNGILKDSNSESGNIIQTDFPVVIGARYDHDGYYSDRFYGYIDEVRIWDVALTEDQIRSTMCKKITSSNLPSGLSWTNLKGYWRFDEGSGTTAYDSSSYGNNGSVGGNGPWENSGAALGDASAYDYDGTNPVDFSANLAHTDGDDITATGDGGTFTGIQVYRVDATSMRTDATKPTGWTMDPLRYWGVFAVGTSPTYTVVYNYDGHPGITNESDLGLACRDNNSVDAWADLNADLDPDANTLTKTGQSGTEYALGSKTGDNSLPVELSVFTAQFLNGVPTLYWRTMSETDNIGWFIYRNAEEDFTTAERITDYLIEGYGTTSESHYYFYYDEELEPISGDRYWYWLESVDLGGAFHRYSPQVLTIPPIPEHQSTTEIPIQYGLHQNEPNPLGIKNSSTSISFLLPKTARAEVKIYNIRGELVRNLYKGIAYGDDEVKDIIWNGRDENGIEQVTGIYLYQLKVNGKVYETKRLIVIR